MQKLKPGESVSEVVGLLEGLEKFDTAHPLSASVATMTDDIPELTPQLIDDTSAQQAYAQEYFPDDSGGAYWPQLALADPTQATPPLAVVRRQCPVFSNCSTLR